MSKFLILFHIWKDISKNVPSIRDFRCIYLYHLSIFIAQKKSVGMGVFLGKYMNKVLSVGQSWTHVSKW